MRPERLYRPPGAPSASPAIADKAEKKKGTGMRAQRLARESGRTGRKNVRARLHGRMSTGALADWQEVPRPRTGRRPRGFLSRERNGGGAFRQLRLVVRLDMDGDAHARDRGLKRILDPVADHMAFADAHAGVDD